MLVGAGDEVRPVRPAPAIQSGEARDGVGRRALVRVSHVRRAVGVVDGRGDVKSLRGGGGRRHRRVVRRIRRCRRGGRTDGRGRRRRMRRRRMRRRRVIAAYVIRSGEVAVRDLGRISEGPPASFSPSPTAAGLLLGRALAEAGAAWDVALLGLSSRENNTIDACDALLLINSSANGIKELPRGEQNRKKRSV